MNNLTIRELEPDAGTRRFAVRLWESENVLTEEQLRALRDAADVALKSEWNEWESDLLYISRAMTPLWSGVIKHPQAGRDAALDHMISQGYIRQVGLEGFVITEKGREYLRKKGIQ